MLMWQAWFFQTETEVTRQVRCLTRCEAVERCPDRAPFRVLLEGQVGVRIFSTSWKEAPLWTHLPHMAVRRHSSLRVKTLQ